MGGLVSGTLRMCEFSGVCDMGGGWGEEPFVVSEKSGAVRRVLEDESQDSSLVSPVVLSLSSGQSFRAPSHLPTSPDSAQSTPSSPALTIAVTPSLGALLLPWAPQLVLRTQPEDPLGTKSDHVPPLLRALLGSHLAQRPYEVLRGLV